MNWARWTEVSGPRPNHYRAVDNPRTSTIKTAKARLAINANAPCQGWGWK
jgi:hypothetical protein